MMQSTRGSATQMPPPNIPETIRTERLLLRKPRPGDGEVVNKAIVESFRELSPWMAWAQVVPPVADTEANLLGAIAKWEKGIELRLLGFDRATGDFVLSAGFHDLNWEVPSMSVGYWVRSSAKGRGFVTEAVRAHAHFGFDVLGAKRISLTADEKNGASRRVAERAGFRLEGILRNECLNAEGLIRNTAMYSMISKSEITIGGKVEW